MLKKTVNYMIIAVAVLVATFTVSFGVYEYNREHAFRVDILHSQLQLNNYYYLEHRADPTIRVTVLDTLGNVVSDTQQPDVSKMDNHLHREEIQEALRMGNGYAIKRASGTNGEKYFYSATRFGNKIIRSSVAYSAPLTSSLERDYTFFYYTVGILLLIAIVLYLRYRLHRSEADKMRIKRQLTENAAHELKTPAATIEGYLETLATNPNMPEAKRSEFIDRCYTQSRRMSSLLADMSMLTRLDEANITRPATEFDAASILRQIAHEMRPLFDDKRIELRLTLPDQILMTGDAKLIDSLCRNIISNALAYASTATYLSVTATINGKLLTLTFVDNGIGVPVEHLPHIFERFYRIDKGRSRRLGGTGLGLAIVKNIALKYGGSVEAMPTYGGGLTIVATMFRS